MRRQIDDELLEMALAGFRAKREEIRQAMAAIEQQLGMHKGSATTGVVTGEPGGKPKRKLSAAGKRAIQAAVKRRWAAFHAKAGTPKAARKTSKPKRTLSPAAKARLVANLAKARAAKASKRAATSVA